MWSSIHKKATTSASKKSPTNAQADDESNMENYTIDVENTNSKVGFDEPTNKEVHKEERKEEQGEEQKEEMAKKSNETYGDIPIFGDSPHLFDEISISTKGSLGNGTIVEAAFDLQTERESIYNEGESIHDYINDKSCGYGSSETKDSANCKDQDQHMDRNHTKSYEEVDVDELSFHQEDSLSYNSFQRLEKQATLRNKVNKDRENLSSKLSILQSLSTQKYEEEKVEKGVEERLNKDQEKVEEKEERESVTQEDTAAVNQEVFFDLGNLMCMKDPNNNEVVSKPSTDNDQPGTQTVVKQTFFSHLLSTKNFFYAVVLLSFFLNILNLIATISKGEEHENQGHGQGNHEEEMVSKVLSLLLVQLKLNKVHDEVTKFHLQNNRFSTSIMVFVSSFMTLCVLLMTSWLKALKENKVDVKHQEKKEMILSPTPKKLQRELSSLDKKNIFPSTVSAPLVQRDGSLTEVKRTMRFSPEVKRFSPGFRARVRSGKSTPSKHSESKRATIFSPELKMKTIKELK